MMNKKKMTTAMTLAFLMTLSTGVPNFAYAEETSVEPNQTEESIQEEIVTDVQELTEETNEETSADNSAISVSTLAELQTAISNIEENGTITLTANIVGDILIANGKTFTIEMGTNTITGQVKVNNLSTNVTINGGTITKNGVNTDQATVFALRGKVTLNNVQVKATGASNNAVAVAVYDKLDTNSVNIEATQGYGIGFFSVANADGDHLSANANLNATNVSAFQNPISTNAASSDEEMVVNINGGNYNCTNANGNWSYVGIYWASKGSLNITGNGTFSSDSAEAAALFVKNGTITIENGTFNGTKDGLKITSEEMNAQKIDVTIEDGTFGGTRCGLYVKSKSNGAALEDGYNVKVTDGTFNGDDWSFYTSIDAGYEPTVEFNGGTWNNVFYASSLTKFISGGTYSFEPVGLIADNHRARENTDGTWTVR